jgi:hypothetical protein
MMAGSSGRNLPQPTPDARAEWVRDMQEHFSKTGSYRAEDLQRVLGDPRKGVGAESSLPLLSAAKNGRT